MKKSLAILLAVLMLATMFAGCSKNDGGGNTGDTTDTTTPEQTANPKVISYANGAEPPVLEPIMSNYAKTSILIYNLYCGLTRISADDTAELAYAESYEKSDDGLVYTFKLRKDAKFSDGSPITAKDYAESFIYQIDPEVAAPGGNLKMFVKNAKKFNQEGGKAEEVGIKALDDYTLEITLENPTPYFLSVACSYLPYKLDVIKGNPDWCKKPETYIGNGAFRVKEINPQVSFVLEKNPYYYDADNVKIDQVNFMFIDDPAVELQAYKNGTINVSDNLNAEAIAAYKETPEYFSASKIGVMYMTIHCKNIPDAKVRQALTYAIDRRTIIEDVLAITYKPATGLVPYGIHWGDKEYRDVAGDVFTTDVEKAKKLLADAGYPDGKGMPKLRMICQNIPNDIDTMQAVQSMLKTNLGIESEITTYESSVYWDVFDTDDWDIARDGWTGDYDDPQTNMFLWEAYREGPDKDARWSGLPASIKYDELMQQSYAELDPEKRFKIFEEAEKVLLDDMPVIPMFFYDDPILMKPEVTGVLKSSIGHVFFHYADVKTK